MGMVGQKGRELLERFCERMTCRIPSTCGWDIVGTWHTGQRRSRADCCGDLNSGADLGKRSGPAVLEESAVLSHGRSHRFDPCHAHQPKRLPGSLERAACQKICQKIAGLRCLQSRSAWLGPSCRRVKEQLRLGRAAVV